MLFELLLETYLLPTVKIHELPTHMKKIEAIQVQIIMPTWAIHFLHLNNF